MTTYNNSFNNAFPNIAAHAVLIGEAGSATLGVVLGAGQVLVGVAGSDPVAQTLANVSTWVAQSTGTVTMAVNTGYVITDASAVTLTLPTTAPLGSVIEVVGLGAGGWTIAQNASGQIHFGNVSTTSGTGGSLASSNQYDAVRLVNVTANNIWNVVSSQGNLAYV